MKTGEGAAREVIQAFNKTQTEREEITREIDSKITAQDRERVRADLASLADDLRRNKGLTVLQTRQFLHEMLDVSV